MTARQALEAVAGPPPDLQHINLLCDVLDALKKSWRGLPKTGREKIRLQMVELAHEALRLYPKT